MKRTTMGATPGEYQPTAIASRSFGSGPRNVRRTRLFAPSAPTTRSKACRPLAAVRTSPRATSTTLSATCRAPAAVARRSSQASSSRRDAIATGSRSGTSTAPPSASNRQDATRRAGRGSLGGPAGSSPSALPVRPPPHGFSRGCDASKTVASMPPSASFVASSEPAGPAPTIAILNGSLRDAHAGARQSSRVSTLMRPPVASEKKLSKARRIVSSFAIAAGSAVRPRPTT